MQEDTKDKSVHFDSKKKKIVGLTAEVKKQLRETFPGVDVEKEILKMQLWLCDCSIKGRKGTIGFVMNWLQKVSPSPESYETMKSIRIDDTPLGLLYREYLADLWKNRENLLDFNTINR